MFSFCFVPNWSWFKVRCQTSSAGRFSHFFFPIILSSKVLEINVRRIEQLITTRIRNHHTTKFPVHLSERVIERQQPISFSVSHLPSLNGAQVYWRLSVSGLPESSWVWHIMWEKLMKPCSLQEALKSVASPTKYHFEVILWKGHNFSMCSFLF